jgi:hypothetical protein
VEVTEFYVTPEPDSSYVTFTFDLTPCAEHCSGLPAAVHPRASGDRMKKISVRTLHRYEEICLRRLWQMRKAM